MKQASVAFEKMLGLSTFLEQHESLDESLTELAAMAAEILAVDTCSLMLFKDSEQQGDYRLRIFAKHGNFPPQAFDEAMKVSEGIAGHVAATGQALLVDNIQNSPYQSMARRPGYANQSFISVPVMINRKVVGVMNLSDAKDGHCMNDFDLRQASFVALLVGKSLQVIHLQNILKSRFAQIAIARDTKKIARTALSEETLEPSKVARMLAKSFYREMIRNGFSTDHIINAASEIIAQLTEELRRHKNAVAGEAEEDSADFAGATPNVTGTA